MNQKKAFKIKVKMKKYLSMNIDCWYSWIFMYKVIIIWEKPIEPKMYIMFVANVLYGLFVITMKQWKRHRMVWMVTNN